MTACKTKQFCSSQALSFPSLSLHAYLEIGFMYLMEGTSFNTPGTNSHCVYIKQLQLKLVSDCLPD